MSVTVRKIHPSLPVFRIDGASREAVYTPGHVALTSGPPPEALLAHAQESVNRARDLSSAPFAPECLAVSLGNRCNLKCSYCYSAGVPGRIAGDASPRPIPDATIAAAARLVAENCARAGKPFHLVLQGDGEPALEWGALRRVADLTREAASSAGTGWFGYVSTNGTLTVERAVWLARNFSRVSLSCDGPPDIHDAQRPFDGGEGSSAGVARTARAILTVRGRLDVRSTITPHSMNRQVEIAGYLCHTLGATHIRYEPAYGSGFRSDDADLFAVHVLEAQQAAQAAGAELTMSGVRLDEIHGPYCDVLRQTLRLGADGAATACFHHTSPELVVGRMDERAGRFVLDTERATALRAVAGRIPDGCQDCVNALHCARGCPDDCLLDGWTGGGFRCRLFQRLSAEVLAALIA